MERSVFVKQVWEVLKEQVKYTPMMVRISRYEDRANYQSHYLGLLWEILNPLIQVAIYFLVFGYGLRGSSTLQGTDISFLEWMLAGIVPWFFINSVVMQGTTSIFNKIHLVSKMNFPMSILPNITIISNLMSYFVMTIIMVIIFLLKGTPINIYWGQYLYYFVAMILFLFSFSLFNATITVLIRDYQMALQSIMRVLFYLTGIVWNIPQLLPEWAANLLKLNPFMYIVDGFRDSLLLGKWFWESPSYTIYFWLLTFFFLFVGSILHMKFRERFVDFI
ncbi:Teichoic acid translocation permease protein tagG [Listeria fleischmannii 1991]|uniref:Transport permease protein n=2 Tax=Listeria fleischmannii TaxID=1069827 RepID=A0A2X3GA24_9LIST|nr:Teichoic acid translocation permease protein tagG [Listeria fleischmannii 1991]SQC64988.1 ABC-2 type transporter [Listeria fleischmannii subsp. fleischmannii]